MPTNRVKIVCTHDGFSDEDTRLNVTQCGLSTAFLRHFEREHSIKQPELGTDYKLEDVLSI